MGRKLIVIWMVLLAFSATAGIDKEHFFDVFGGNSASKITAERIKLEKMKQTSEVKAYLGAMIMKEAQFKSSSFSKLSHFTKGRKLLELQIADNTSEVEFRILRLMIQENCPKILYYYSEIESDASLITKKYASLDEAIKTVVLAYAKKSDALSASKLK